MYNNKKYRKKRKNKKGEKMITYEPFRGYVAANNIKKKDIMQKTGISSSTMSKLKHDQYVSIEIIDRLCRFLNIDIKDIVRYKD